MIDQRSIGDKVVQRACGRHNWEEIMRIILVDDKGRVEVFDPQLSKYWSDNKVSFEELFVPCGNCGLGVLHGDYDWEADMCKECEIEKIRDVLKVFKWAEEIKEHDFEEYEPKV